MADDKDKIPRPENHEDIEFTLENKRKLALTMKQIARDIDLLCEEVLSSDEVREAYRQIEGVEYEVNRLIMAMAIVFYLELEKVKQEEDIMRIAVSIHTIEMILRQLMGLTDEYLLNDAYYMKLMKHLDHVIKNPPTQKY